MAIVIQRFGNPLAEQDLAQQEPIPLGIFVGAEHGRHHDAGRIVDGREQGAVRLIGPEPRMRTAIHLEQHAGLREALPPPAMSGRTPRMGGRGPAVPKNPLDAGPAEEQIMFASQELGNMAIVAVSVVAGDQPAHLVADGLGQSPGLGPTLVAMHESRGSGPPEGSL